MTDCDHDQLSRRSDALERVTDGILSLDADFRYTYLNSRAEKILDRSSDELLGNTVWDVFPETAGTVAEEELEAAMTTQQQRSFERYNPELDRWFDVRAYPDENGLTTYFTDITKQKEAERELEETNRQLTALVENTSEAIYIKDTEGHYELMNEAAADFFGVDPEDAIGKHDEELFDTRSVADIRKVDDKILAEDEADSREAIRYIDGQKYIFLDNKYPYHDEDGEVIGVMGISRDITERKRREQRLKELSEEYGAIFDNAEDAIFLIDVETPDSEPVFRFERLSPSHESTSGLLSADIQGQTPREALGDELGAEVEANYRRCVNAREPITYEEALPMPDGRIIWQTKLTPIIVDDEVIRIVGIARDITDRVEQEQKLRRKTARLDEFASVISHDLRNPLNIAQGRATLLREMCADEHLDHLTQVIESLDRMETIIEDTLTLAQQGDIVGDTSIINITDLIGQCWKGVETTDATLEIVDEFAIDGDRDRLRHVFENLIRNAVQHGGETVTVRVGRAGEGSIYVEDDGPGIPEDERERVFEPGQTSSTEGTGFGLTIVKRIAEAHNWEVSITASRDGGTRFNFHSVELFDE